MARVTGDDIQYKLEEINDIIGRKYRLEHPGKERDWKTYEQEFSQRIKTAMRDLDPQAMDDYMAMHEGECGGRYHEDLPLLRTLCRNP